MNEFRIKVTVRNNLILSAIEDAGYKGWGSLSRFCNESVMTMAQLSDLTSFRSKPITNDGEFSTAAKLLMEALGAAPSDLWTDQQLMLSMAKNSAETTSNAESMGAVLLSDHMERMTLPGPEQAADDGMTRRLLSSVLVDGLSERERQIIDMRYGTNGANECTLEECAKVFGVTRERIRQIEMRALRKLRHPEFKNKLLPALDWHVEIDNSGEPEREWAVVA